MTTVEESTSSRQTTSRQTEENGAVGGVPHLNIPHYGNQNTMTAAQWWMLFVQYCTLYKFKDSEVVQRLPFVLKDRPLQWFFTLSTAVKSNVERVRTAFLDRFGNSNDALSDSIRNIKQKANETVEDYVSRVLQINECEEPLPLRTLVRLTSEGLKPAVAEMVLQQNCVTMEDVIHHGKRAERTLAITRKPSEDNLVASMEVMEDRLFQRLSNQMDKTVAAITAKQRTNPIGPPQRTHHTGPPQGRPQFQNRSSGQQTGQRNNSCRGCGKFCRVRSSCPSFNQNCKYCGRLNHFVRVCMKKKADVANGIYLPNNFGQ